MRKFSLFFIVLWLCGTGIEHLSALPPRHTKQSNTERASHAQARHSCLAGCQANHKALQSNINATAIEIRAALFKEAQLNQAAQKNILKIVREALKKHITPWAEGHLKSCLHACQGKHPLTVAQRKGSARSSLL